MTETTTEIHSRLDRIRRRWRRLELLKAVSIAVVEALGLLMVFMVADYLCRFSPAVRLVLFGVWVLAVALVLVWCVSGSLRRKIKDMDVALLVERRNPELQGALLSATEFGGQKGSPLHNFIIDVLVREASQRIQFVDVRRTVRFFARLRKYVLACVVMVLVFALTGAFFPQYLLRQGARVLMPWSSQAEDGATDGRWSDGILDPNNLSAPVRFRITPKNVEILERGSVQVIAELSRDPLGRDVVLFVKSEKGAWEKIAMKSVKRIYTFDAPIQDIMTPLEYYVAVGDDASPHYRISVREPLRVTGLELTTEYPSYLRLPPVTKPVYSGDIATLAGSKVTLNIKTNQAVTEGKLMLGSGQEVPLAVGPKGAKVTLAVAKDDTYRYTVKNVHGEEVGSDTLYFIQALPDNPPVMEVVEPNIDLALHQLSEITCTLKVSEDWALADVRICLDVMRQAAAGGSPDRAQLTRSFLPKEWRGRVDGRPAALTLMLDEFKPLFRGGDSIFYHFEVEDRKGQKAVSDLFYVSVTDPEMFMFYAGGKPHAPSSKLMVSPMLQIIAAAWHLEQQRDKLAADKFLEQSQDIARKMIHPSTGALIDFIALGADGNFQGPKLPPSDPRKQVADTHTNAGYELLKKGEPGKAVAELNIVWAILKQFQGDQKLEYANIWTKQGGLVSDQSQSFTLVMTDLTRIDMSRLADMAADIPASPTQEVDYRRTVGRKELEKVAEARKNIADLKKDVEKIAREAQDEQDNPENKTPDQKTAQGGKPDADKKKTPDFTEGQKKNNKGGAGGNDEKKTAAKQDGKGGDEKKGDAAQQADRKGEQGTLKDRTQTAAEKAEKLARDLQEALGNKDNRDIKDGLDNLRGAADELRRAADEFDKTDLEAGANRSRTATRLLDKADGSLENLKFGKLSDMVAEAIAQGHRLADRQERVEKATGELAVKAKEARDAKAKGDPKADAEQNAIDEKAKGLGTAQTALGEQAEALKNFVEKLQKAAQDAKEKRASALLEEGVTAMKRGEFPQKMVDAAVDLNLGNLPEALGSQKEASKTLAGVMDSLYRASDALSGTKEKALEVAARRAREIKQKAIELSGLDEKKVAEAAGKSDESKKGDDKKGDDKKGGDKKGGDKKGPAESRPTGPRLAREASDLWGEVRTLAGDLGRLEYVPKTAVDQLSSLGQDEFRGMFEKMDEKQVTNFVAVMARVSKLLDEKLLEAQTSRKLESGLRDGCPPEYRKLVGKYYSILSGGE